MIFDGIDFHNVSAMIPREDGHLLSRLPADVVERLNPAARSGAAWLGSGVELRFRLNGGAADIFLRAENVAEALPVHIYYGDFQGGWEYSAKLITTKRSCIHVEPSAHMTEMRALTQSKRLRYRPEMIRLVLPYLPCVYLGCTGDIEPPRPGDAPERTLLCYGSSITHGSLSLGAGMSYASLLAGHLHCDYLNLGLAGSCHLDDAMAEHIFARQDWHLATVEMGINMLNFGEEEFRARVRSFVAAAARDPRPVYVTSLFVYGLGDDPKGAAFRRIVREETAGRLPFIDGMKLLDDPALLAADMVHPSQEAHRHIARRWADFITEEQR